MSSRPHRLLSLDLATNLGWAFGDTEAGDPVSGTHRLPKTGEDVGAFLAAYHLWLVDRFREFEPDVVVFEAPVPAGGATNMATILKLWGLCSHTEFVCAMKRTPAGGKIAYRQVNVSEWKKGFVGWGGFSKPKTKAALAEYPVMIACRQRKLYPADDNEADALGLWCYAMRFVSPGMEARFDPLARGTSAVAHQGAPQ